MGAYAITVCLQDIIKHLKGSLPSSSCAIASSRGDCQGHLPTENATACRLSVDGLLSLSSLLEDHRKMFEYETCVKRAYCGISC